jgi:hypothetical protein
LVAYDLKTKLVLQPRTSCKFNVFVEKKDVSEEVRVQLMLKGFCERDFFFL